MGRIEIDLLENFVRVAESRSLTEAARALFLSQPTLTARMRVLERELGVELFLRGGGGLRLSPAGEYLLPLAHDTLSTLDRIRTAAKDYRSGELAPPIVIASSMTLSQCFLPKCLRAFLSRHPFLRVSVVSVHGSEVPRLLRSGAANMGVMHQPREFHPADLVQVPLYSSPMVPVARPGHRLVEREVGLADLTPYPLITFCEESRYWAVLERWFRRFSYRPRACIRLNHIPTMEEVALQTGGVSFLPADAVEDAVRTGRLARVDITERLPRTFVRVMHAEDTALTPAAVHLLTCLRDHRRHFSRHLPAS